MSSSVLTAQRSECCNTWIQYTSTWLEKASPGMVGGRVWWPVHGGHEGMSWRVCIHWLQAAMLRILRNVAVKDDRTFQNFSICNDDVLFAINYLEFFSSGILMVVSGPRVDLHRPRECQWILQISTWETHGTDWAPAVDYMPEIWVLQEIAWAAKWWELRAEDDRGAGVSDWGTCAIF